MCVSSADDADAQWTVVSASGDRLMTDGTPVHVGAPVSFIHVMSNVMLATCVAQPRGCRNYFMHDCHCHSHPIFSSPRPPPHILGDRVMSSRANSAMNWTSFARPSVPRVRRALLSTEHSRPRPARVLTSGISLRGRAPRMQSTRAASLP